ncbi:hypothetical protein L6164_013547 [Bauhinia variegata]|uniref:Uncharacterized protein n=1 Tax=Bauhinia variegata TaxID=167791 RepID=A0ACB9NEN8_BAUVA|nr:hypothetical protein L6164_013547 [Bauhinia variegata]
MLLKIQGLGSIPAVGPLTSNDPDNSSSLPTQPNGQISQHEQLGRGQRVKQPPARLYDNILNTVGNEPIHVFPCNNNLLRHALSHYTHQDLGNRKYFLGILVARSPDGLFHCQRKYAIDILQNHRLALAKGLFTTNPAQYRRSIRRLIYLCFTRPDLSYSVYTLFQFMQQPR